MAHWRRPTTNGISLVAAAEKIPNEVETRRRTVLDWQRRSWVHYDSIGEIWYSINYLANALRRIRIYPATQEEPDQPPVPVESGQAVDEMDRLRDIDGTHGEIIHDAALQFVVPGEAYLAGHQDFDREDEETWAVYSTTELEKRSDGVWVLKDGMSNQEDKILVDPVVQRIWRPHPRYRRQADSPLRALAKSLDELLLLDQLYRSNARSRVPSGIMLIPDEVNLRTSKRPGLDTGDGQGPKQDPFVRAVIDALVTPLADEESAANVAPPVIKVKGSLIEQFKHLTFGREFDSATAARYDKVLQRVANGLPLPNEVVTGPTTATSGWRVDEGSFDFHFAPLMQLVCSALTEAFLAPALAKNGEHGVFVWYDPSSLLTHPHKAEDADSAFDRLTISNKAYLRYKGYKEDDAPTDEEIETRIEQIKAMKATAAPPGGAGPSTPAVPGPQGQTGVEGPQAPEAPQAPNAPTAPNAPGIAASAVSSLGRELAELDRELLEQVQTSAEATVQRLLAKRVAAKYGNDTVISSLVDEENTDEAVAAAVPVFTRLVSKAQKKLRTILRRQGVDPERIDELEETQNEAAARGAGVFEQALRLVIVGVLFGVRPGQEQGEISELTVPAGAIRTALAVAGGGVEAPVTGAPQGGVFTGDTALSWFADELGRTPDAFEWSYGDEVRKYPFLGHQNLDGVRFLDWQDEKLAVQPEDSWLGVSHYSPGEHAGCMCVFVPVFGGE